MSFFHQRSYRPSSGPALIDLGIASRFQTVSYGFQKVIYFAQKVIDKFESIGNQTNFYGFKDQNFIQKKLCDASIIVIPSIWEEPFGLVAAEAMSNGVAIIASKVGGIPEIVKENGILIENVNTFKIEKAIIELIKNDKKRKQLQNNAWKKFNLFSINSSRKLDDFRKSIFQKHYNSSFEFEIEK